MHDTIWNGKTQKMVDSKGSPKGMRLILEERGVDGTQEPFASKPYRLGIIITSTASIATSLT